MKHQRLSEKRMSKDKKIHYGIPENISPSAKRQSHKWIVIKVLQWVKRWTLSTEGYPENVMRAITILDDHLRKRRKGGRRHCQSIKQNSSEV